MSDHIPDSGQHRTLFYAEYANRARGTRASGETESAAGPAEEPRKRSSPSWARMIAKVYQVDPLVCSRCGKRMSIVGFVNDSIAIRRVLDHLGLSVPEAAKPPPIREVVRVAEHGEGWGRAGGVGLTQYATASAAAWPA